MATSTTTPSTEMSHTTFSYAQAAKGQIATQPAPQPSSSPAPPSISSQGKDDATTVSTAVTAMSTTSSDHEARDQSKQAKVEDETSAQKHEAEVSSPREPTGALNTSDTTVNAVVNGDSASAESTPAANEEKGQRSSSRTSRSTDGETRKGRKGKKGKHTEKDGDVDKAQEDEKEKEPPKPVILSEAPIPSVNPWHKRIEAQAAKKVAPAPNSQAPTAPAAGTHVNDSKKRTTTEEIDTPAGAQNGASGEKAQRKSVDLSRVAEQLPRRSGPRGSRVAEKDEKAGSDSLPPVADSTLWPDVKAAVAAEEGKKKPQEKAERAEKEGQDETGPSKRAKKGWVAIPYVPTVNFQTPMPQRNPKPRGGARGGREAGATRGAQSNVGNANAAPLTSPTADKAPTSATAAPAKEGRPRDGSGPTRANSLPPSASKRASIDSSFGRELRKPSASAATDRPRDAAAENPSPATVKTENGRVGRTDFSQPSSEQQSHFSRNFSDARRTEPGFEGYKGFKDAGISTPKDQNFAGRERAEGRGRGGYRARGGHNVSVGHGQQGGYAPNGQYASHTLPARQNGPYSPPAHQNAFGTYSTTRGAGRGSGRGSSGTGYGRVGSNGAASKMAPVNTGNVGYDYQMPQYATYPPIHQPVYDATTISLLMLQVEYYLSVDNLCKDYFIRRRMDSQGFVPFALIAGFNRLKDLAPDVDAIRLAAETSDKLDYIVGEDGVERLRLHDKWDQFVLAMSDREEEARHDGPTQLYMRSRHSRPAFPVPMLPAGYHATSPTIFPGNFPEEQMYQQPYMNGAHYDASINGGDMNGHRYAPETQLSATVPEFSPSIQQTPFTLEGATTFSDEQVETLMVVVHDKPKRADAPVVNGTAGTSEHPYTNGVAPATGSNSESQSPSSAPKSIVYTEGQKPASSHQESEERYVDLRKKALEDRHFAKAGETPHAMKTLYEFWAHFLVQSFNPRMYEEFRNYAIEDASKEVPTRVGLKHLLQYYNELLLGDKPKPWGNDRPVPEIFNLHYQGAKMVDPNMGGTNGEPRT